MRLDLNCDLGEGESPARTRGLLRWVTSANVACGGHAGDLASMMRCVGWVKDRGVRLGAHPGPWSRGDFGRGAVTLTPDELELLLLQQVGALQRLARSRGVRLHHVKLHGALYHASEADPALGRRYLETVQRWFPECVIYALAGGTVAALGKRLGVRVWEEIFADRAYDDDGRLVPRTRRGAVLRTTAVVRVRLRGWLEQGTLRSISGKPLPLRGETICVHGDTPDAPGIARAVRAELD